MGRYVFKIEWVREKSNRINGYLRSNETGKRWRSRPDYILVNRKFPARYRDEESNKGWHVCTAAKLNDEYDGLEYTLHRYAYSSQTDSAAFRSVTEAKDWCDREQRKENFVD